MSTPLPRLALLFTLCATASPNFAQQNSACLVQQATKNGRLEWTFRYNEQGQIAETVQYDDKGAVAMRSAPEYFPGTNAIQSFTQYDGEQHPLQKSVYQRDAQLRVTKLELYRPDAEGKWNLLKYLLYENSADPQFCLRRVSAYDAAGNLLETTEIQYSDSNGSYTSTKKKADGTLSRTETWTRDDKSGYEAWSPFPYLAVHNLLGKEIVLADGTRAPESFHSVMTYNSQGYPVSEVATRADGSVDRFEYSYICR